MTFLSASNDTSFYVGSTTNMSYTDSETMIWRLKSLLKTAGWTVAAFGKGTGVATTGLYSDPFTTASLFYTGAAEGSNTARGQSWFVIVQPGGSRSLCFQHVNGTAQSTSWRAKYSPGGFSITGTLNSSQTPAAITSGDEFTSTGGGTDAVPTFQQLFETSTRVHGLASNVTPYGFWFAAYVQSGAANAGFGRTAIALDPLLVGSYPAGDTDPFIAYIRYGNNGNNLPPWRVDVIGDKNAANAPLICSFARGLQTAAIVPVTALKYTDAATNVCIPAGFISNSFDSTDEVFPIPYGRVDTAGNISGWKGVSTLFRWDAVNRTAGDTVTTTVSGARDYIVLSVSGVIAQWSGEIPTP